MRGEHYIWQDGTNIHLEKEMPLTKFDELAVMRIAQLTPLQIKEAKERAIKNWSGNIGAEALIKQTNKESEG